MVVFVATGAAVACAGLLDAYTMLRIATECRAVPDAAMLRYIGDNGPVSAVFFGLWLLPLGYLVIRSGYFPKILGILLVIGGVSYLADAAVVAFSAESGRECRRTRPRPGADRGTGVHPVAAAGRCAYLRRRQPPGGTGPARPLTRPAGRRRIVAHRTERLLVPEMLPGMTHPATAWDRLLPPKAPRASGRRPHARSR